MNYVSIESIVVRRWKNKDLLLSNLKCLSPQEFEALHKIYGQHPVQTHGESGVEKNGLAFYCN